jgi:hypothetical protein
MASSSGVIFPESMVDFLANLVDICFGSMPAVSSSTAAYLIMESTVVTSNQQVESDLLAETHPPTPRDLIAGLDRIESILSDTIKVCKCAKHPRETTSPSLCMPLGLWNTAPTASRHMKKKI